MTLGIVVVSTVFLLCMLGDSSSASAKSLSSSVAYSTSFSAEVVGRESKRLNEETQEWEYGHFLTFDAVDRRRILNNGELKVPREVYVRSHRGDKGVLSVDHEGKFKSYRSVRGHTRPA